jgi:hypothetical protein
MRRPYIIRDEQSLDRIRRSIPTNPLRWHRDRDHPRRTTARNGRFDLFLDRRTLIRIDTTSDRTAAHFCTVPATSAISTPGSTLR